LNRLRRKSQKPFVILSEAKNLSFFSFGQKQERFFASLRMTKFTAFSASGEGQPLLAVRLGAQAFDACVGNF
jgi:hypothetical protein